MAIIRFKTRSLIKRFGSKPIELSDSLARQYLDRNQAIEVIEKIGEDVEKIEDIKRDADRGSSESQEEAGEVEEGEEKVEVKIKMNKKDK